MLKTLIHGQARSIVYRLVLRSLPKPYEHIAGHCWRSPLPRSTCGATGPLANSTLLLFEDDRYLGPPNSTQKHIQVIGRGWYRHEGPSVYFSTPDNTDPNHNQRHYAYSTSRWLFARNSGAANNQLRRDATNAAIEADVDYAIAGLKYQDICGKVGIDDFRGKSVLELGPGPACTWAILLACRGAEVTVVDPYPAAWDESYHPVLFSALRSAISAQSDMDVTPIDHLLEERGFSSRVIHRWNDPIEQSELPSDAFDIVFSNAVGEHFYDCALAFSHLYRITKPGGWGFHWIDFRDHRDFAAPLEYLLMSEAAFAREFGLRRGEIGNRLRAEEMSAIIAEAGLEIVRRDPTITAEPSYLEEFVPRLREAVSSPYRGAAVEDLRTLGECIVVRKPQAPALSK